MLKNRTRKKRISRVLKQDKQDDFSRGCAVYSYKALIVNGYYLVICTARPKRQGASKTTMNEQMFHREHATGLRARRESMLGKYRRGYGKEADA